MLLVLAGVCAPAPAIAGDWTGNANFFLGQKSLDSNDWEPLDNQGEFGAEVSWGKKAWPVLIATDVLVSGDSDEISGVDVDAATTEFDFGVRKIWEVKTFRPYVGGGLAIAGAAFEASGGGNSIDDSDNSVGVWVGGGAFWRLGSRFNIGGAVRYSTADVTLFDEDVDAGGIHIGLLLGWGWPAEK
jgi:hypothetical protein